MKRILVLAVAVAAAAMLPAVAGDDHEHAYKCEQEAQACLNMMASHFEGRGWAGVEMKPSDAGLAVRTVHAGTPAAKHGVQVGDVLLAINGIELNEQNKEKLGALEQEMTPGTTFTYTISRKGKQRDLKFALAEMPIEVAAKMVGRHMLEQHTTIEVASADSN